jgi:hypothetical protein
VIRLSPLDRLRLASAIVRHAEALGLDVERRPDATPSVVLMPAATLEVAIGTAA